MANPMSYKRQKLCAILRNQSGGYYVSQDGILCHAGTQAADEIERLVKENVRLVAENRELKTELDDS